MKLKSKFGIGVVLSVFVTAPVFAQVGDDNYTGTSGWFKGEVTTGCSYNAYTGSASRSVLDISVGGAVGVPLVFTRTSTSRYTAGVTTEMGKAGSWLHSYSWSIDTYTGTQSGYPAKFVVNYPDGRRITFTNISDAYIMAPPGVSGIIDFGYDNNPPTQGHCYVNLGDGTQVRFSVAISNNAKKFIYTLQSLRDPYGQITTVSKVGNLMTVTEPAGRMLKIYYGTGPAGDSVITRVEEWMSATLQGRTIQYNYSLYTPGGNNSYSALTSVTYKDTPANGQAMYATATYTYQNDNLSSSGRPLLSSADDPMYAGPMRKIQYSYSPAGHNADGTNVVSGQILSEKSGTTGQAVSTLTISSTGRGEATGDGRSRTFTFMPGGLVTSFTDFRSKTSSYAYTDGSTGGVGTGFPNQVTDRNGHQSDYYYNPYSRLLEGISPPLTPNDTPQGTPRTQFGTQHSTVNCPDPNNRDWYHAYFPYFWQDEAGNQTVYLRDTNKRIVQVNYPDGGTESFTYNNFGQVLTHRLQAGGLETFTYDNRGLLTEYRDPYHLATQDPQHPEVPTNATPTVRYSYDSLDRVASITDALGSGITDWNHTTSYLYNWRGQVTTTTLPIDPIDSQRHTIVNAYNNATGTLTSVTDQLNHITSYTYDDYRRVRSITTPGHNTPVPTTLFYDANGAGEDYTHTDANVTYMILPSGKKLITAYNENKQKISVTAVGSDGVTDKAVTTLGYDDNGNATSIKSPKEQPGQQFAGKSTITAYDERNRRMSITDAINISNPTTFWYDSGGRKWKTIRSNGQITTFDSYDLMNRLLQQTVQQTPDPNAVTRWTYYTSGLLHTMQDPHLVETSSSEMYNYSYDVMGRKIGLQYPLDMTGARTTEAWRYETRGLVDQFTNRNTKHQTLVYDNLSRLTDTSWDDGGITPPVHNSYDAASRLIGVRNPSGTPVISRVLFNDGLLNSETTTYDDNTPRTVTYSYDSDSNRASIQWPNGAYSFTYQYTGRNQLWKILNGGNPVVTYGYDSDGNLQSRAPDNSTNSTFICDELDRVTHIGHTLNGTTRTLDYAYDSVGNRKWAKRDSGAGDVFGYDLNDQSTSVLLNVPNPDTTSPGSQTIVYDANGNRTTFSPYGTTDTYVIDNNSLNQYHTRNGGSASYDPPGNMTGGFDGSTYSYDPQNRLLTATKPPSNTPVVFSYDGLNRQFKRVANRTVQPVSAVSRMIHGGAGAYDVQLPLTGSPGIECRSSTGNFQMILTFASGVNYAGASVTTGTGSVSATSISADRTQITINLTGVANDQNLVVTLSGVNDGWAMNNVPVAMGVLKGDTNADGFVDSGDKSQVQGQLGQPVTGGNFREDVNVDGFIDSADVSAVSGQLGNALPSFSQGAPTPAPVYSVYDGWNLIAEYAPGSSTPSNAYLFGAGGLIKNLVSNMYYYQDASGSTSHLASNTGALLEWYRYDLQGTPLFYDVLNNQLSFTHYGVRHLFTGQQWCSDIGLYDLRNRFYLPDVGRFLQTDPIGFAGDMTNLYRYVGNNPLSFQDPFGLFYFNRAQFMQGALQLGIGVGVLYPSVSVFWAGAVTSGSGAGAFLAFAGGIGVLEGSAHFLYGAKNVIYAFQDSQKARQVFEEPKSLYGWTGRLLYGEAGQKVGDKVSSLVNIFGAETPLEAALEATAGSLEAPDAAQVDNEMTAASLIQSPSYGKGLGVSRTSVSLQNAGAGSTIGLSAFGFGGVSFWEAGAGTFYRGVTIPDGPSFDAGRSTLTNPSSGVPDTVWAGSGQTLTGSSAEADWSVPGSTGSEGSGSGGCSDTNPDCNKEHK